MKALLYAFLAVLSSVGPAFADPAPAPATQDNSRRCAELQAQWNVDSKSHNPLFSQIRAKHEQAQIKALKCPPPKPAPASAPVAPQKP